MVYMLKNYPDQLADIAKVVCKKISEVKAELIPQTVLFRSCEKAIQEAEDFEIVEQAADLYINVLQFYDSANRQSELEESMELEQLKSNQVERMVELYVSLNLSFGFNLVKWENIYQKHKQDVNAFTSAYIQLQLGKGIEAETIAALKKFEESVLKRVARAENHKFYK